MKVIRPGREQKAPAEEFTCTGKGNHGGGCGALLLVEATDIFPTASFALGERTDYTTFQCPVCRTWTDVTTMLPALGKKPAKSQEAALLNIGED